MLNFASLFNQFRSQSNNGLNDLLEQPNVRMGRLLDEDSFLNEYKSGNSRVAEFMKYEKYEELIEFVTVVGPADDKKRSFKYPLSACELLSIENNTALDLFLPDRQLTVDVKIVEEVEVETQIEVDDSSSEKKETDSTQVAKTEEQKTIIKDSLEATKEVTGENSTIEEVESAPAAVEVGAGVSQVTLEQKTQQTAQPETPEKKKKKIIKKQIKKVEKIIKKEVEPLIEKLLAYFSGEINYTLAGYVSKILTTFINKKPIETLKYLLQENIAQSIIKHAESRSVGDLIVKMLTHETTIFLDLRRNFYKQMLKKLETSSEIMSNLSANICEIIEKIAANLKGNNKIVEFNNVFFSLDVITQVIKNVMSEEENVSVYNAPILLTYLTNVPFVLPQEQDVLNEFKKLGELFIDKSCEKLQVDARSRPKLGIGRIKIIQILRYILKQNVLNSKEIVAQRPKFFSILLNLVKIYHMNNVLHNEVVKIVQIALGEEEKSPLNNAVLADNILLKFIHGEAEEDKKIKAGDSVYKFRKGYIAHVINLCIKLRELSQKNQNIKKLTETSEFSNTYQTFIEKELFNSKKSLAGFAMRKDLKHEIMFQKEDIIAAYVTFLQKCPSPVYEIEQPIEHINIEHPDLVEELQKQLEENLTIKTVAEEQTNEDSAKLSEQPLAPTEAHVVNPQFWTVHLQYNIDDLIDSLL